MSLMTIFLQRVFDVTIGHDDGTTSATQATEIPS